MARGRTSLMTGILVLLVGLVFIGQGLGYLRSSSFMVDDRRWALIGAGMVVVGAAIVAWDRRSRS
ncbi:MAG TPA: hypothetical protein VGQ89_02750 [Candidatus Limnocylindrales bacterium]|jgi:hypothetical protein|nr:hypothetical protein [Candidatus Limnocylindrales bacterium]